MARWQFTLELGEFYHKYSPDGDGEITLSELAGKVAEKIKELAPRIIKLAKRRTIYWGLGEELENEILPLFEEIAENCGDDDIEDFNYAMEQLYDWADIKLDNEWNGKRVCWVDTFSH